MVVFANEVFENEKEKNMKNTQAFHIINITNSNEVSLNNGTGFHTVFYIYTQTARTSLSLRVRIEDTRSVRKERARYLT